MVPAQVDFRDIVAYLVPGTVAVGLARLGYPETVNKLSTGGGFLDATVLLIAGYVAGHLLSFNFWFYRYVLGHPWIPVSLRLESDKRLFTVPSDAGEPTQTFEAALACEVRRLLPFAQYANSRADRLDVFYAVLRLVEMKVEGASVLRRRSASLVLFWANLGGAAITGSALCLSGILQGTAGDWTYWLGCVLGVGCWVFGLRKFAMHRNEWAETAYNYFFAWSITTPRDD